MRIKSMILAFMAFIMLMMVSCGHKHVFNIEWASDDESHWHQCECGEKNELNTHTWDEGTVITEPTLDSVGKKIYNCSMCGKSKTEEIEKLSHEHSYKEEWVSDENSHWHQCECGEIKDKVNHEYEWTVKRNATCVLTKIEEGKCACGYVTTRESEKIPHTWDEGVIISEPEIGVDGQKEYTCTKCGETKEEIIPALDGIKMGSKFETDVMYMISNPLNSLPLTIDVNLKLDSNHYDRGGVILSNYGQDNVLTFEIYTNGNPRIYYTNTDGVEIGYTFDQCDVRENDFVNIILVFDNVNNSLNLYKNGSLAQSIKISSSLSNSLIEENFFIGGDERTNNTQYFKGTIQSLEIYSSIKSDVEVNSMFNNELDINDETLLVGYNFDNIKNARTILDSSKNKNDISVEVKWFTGETIDMDYSYSLAVIGDTQKITEKYPEKLEGIYDWLVENKDNHKIENVIGLGDITETWSKDTKDMLYEWDRAKKAISKMDGVMRYSLIRGNHDEAKYFNQTFGYEAYTSQFDGFMVDGDLCNSYMTFKAGKVDYLLVNLDFGANDEMIKWASDIIVKHPNHQVIIATHAYLYNDGTTLDKNDPSPASRPGNDNNSPALHNGYNDGDQIWEKLIKNHPNIALVLSGHDTTDRVVTTQTEGIHGNTVTQMLINPQGMDADMAGVGMICMLYFNEDGSKVEVEYFSTDKNQHYKYANQYEIDLSNACNSVHEFVEGKDENSHYQECECGYKHNVSVHTWDEGEILEASTCEKLGSIKYTCTECGYVKNDTLPYSHKISEEWLKNDTHHYHQCELCEQVVDETPHLTADFTLDKENGINLSSLCECGYGQRYYLTGDGSENTPYLILDEEDLISLDKIIEFGYDFKNDYVKLNNNISLVSGNIMFDVFSGTFDGNNKVISNLAIENENGQTGLFKVLKSTGIIKNLVIEGKVTGKDKIGGIAGESAGQIINCTNNAHIIGNGLRGGIVGYAASGEIKDCINNGKVDILTSGWNVGGIAGEGSALISNCVNNADVIGKSTHIAGIIGSTTGSVIDCINKGTIAGASWGAGGICGNTVAESVISGCENLGDINGSGQLGGIVGKAYGLIEYSINRGNINGSSDQLGGIVGANIAINNDPKVAGNTVKLIIKNCDNYGDVTGTARLGGIIGRLYNGEIIECVNHSTATIKGTNNVSGIVGEIPWSKDGEIAGNLLNKISGCQNDGVVLNSSYFGGGIVGAANQTMIEQCINNGNVGGTGDCAGGIAGIIYNTVKVIDSHNNGNIYGTNKLGGLAFESRGIFENCTTSGNIYLTTTTGTANELVHTNSGTLTNCSNSGQIINQE